MPIAIVVIGIILAIAAWNDSFPALATELEQDIPGYLKWGFAIAAILALGYIPGMRMPSRWILALVTLAYVLTQWSAFQTAFSNLASTMQSGATASGSGTATPTAAYSAAYAPASQTASAGSPASAGSGATASPYVTATAAASQTVTAAQNLAANPLNPNSYVGLFSGFGGLA